MPVAGIAAIEPSFEAAKNQLPITIVFSVLLDVVGQPSHSFSLLQPVVYSYEYVAAPELDTCNHPCCTIMIMEEYIRYVRTYLLAWPAASRCSYIISFMDVKRDSLFLFSPNTVNKSI